MDYKTIFLKAYQAMDVPMINGDCGELCKEHCCRRVMENGDVLGIYFLPFEYETIHKDQALIDHGRLEIHKNEDYELPVGIDYLVYGYCRDHTNCIRSLRPIQCRTYPFVPHLQNGHLSLTIEEEQAHDCPLLSKPESWNPEFPPAILSGWGILLKIPEIRILVEAESAMRGNVKSATGYMNNEGNELEKI